MFNNFRPNKWEEFIGQDKIINNLKIYLKSAVERNVSLDHLILHGPPGVGKTSLAYLISYILNKKIYVLNGQLLQKPSDIISPLTNLKENEIIFIDEIHAISKEVSEILYPVMEDNKLSVILGKDYSAKVINVKLPNFTLIGATTEINKLANPFINRFPINLQLQNYSKSDMSKIIALSANRLNMNLSNESFDFLAEYTKLNPRIAINTLKRINDYIYIEKPEFINNEYLEITLMKLGIFKMGLTDIEITYLKAIQNQGGVIGVESLKQLLNIPIATIINNIEPVLLDNKLIKKTIKGRELTLKSKELLANI